MTVFMPFLALEPILPDAGHIGQRREIRTMWPSEMAPQYRPERLELANAVSIGFEIQMVSRHSSRRLESCYTITLPLGRVNVKCELR